MSKFLIRFGTDGLRSVFNNAPIDIPTVKQVVSQLLVWVTGNDLSALLTVAVGRDTRQSGEPLFLAIADAITKQGHHVLDLGILPTPAVSFLTNQSPCTLAIMITASHNPSEYNGLKFMNGEGKKFSLIEEKQIEELINCQPTPSENKKKQGIIIDGSQQIDKYVENLKNIYFKRLNMPETSNTEVLESNQNIHISVDCAQGACYQIAPRTLRELGYTVTEIASEPNGHNINHACGSTFPKFLSQKMGETKATIGVAFDGDGDRLILSTHTGKIIDGDGILWLLAPDFTNKNCGIVGTVMTNSSVEKSLSARGVPFVRTPVGDKHIVAALNQKKWQLGGETSGHIITPQFSHMGDAILIFLLILSKLKSTRKTLHENMLNYKCHNQSILNLPITKKELLEDPNVLQDIDRIKSKNNHARYVIRTSGTEDLLRIMVESDKTSTSQALCLEIASVFKKHNASLNLDD